MAWTLWMGLGATLAGLAVALGAFGAHALKARLSEADLATFEIGVRYQMYHALALIAVALLAVRVETWAVRAAGFAFLAGILIFSGSLYTLVLSGHRWLGAITPLGGLAFLAGWALLAYAAFSLGASLNGR